ncbi:MAG: hypothetical protein E5V27_00225 [Mesorhizobium sp.]|nr:MAG: hypothetical protein E5V27_00225 [Mesorhizobium sp.]
MPMICSSKISIASLAFTSSGDVLPGFRTVLGWNFLFMTPGSGDGGFRILEGADRIHSAHQAEEGTPAAEVCRKAGISDATFHYWKKRYCGLTPSEVKRMR